jgi:glyoxylase-like metal-dependent hydrolase (beta-lactamase superfamily II)
MKLVKVQKPLYEIRFGIVNALVLLEPELTVFDTGVPGSADEISQALEQLGRRAEDVKHIVITHLHADHTGGLAELKRRSGASVYMHRLDAELVEKGGAAREMNPSPGLFPWLVTKLFMKNAPSNVDPCRTDVYLEEGQELEFAGGMEVIYTPGHAAGHVSLLWPEHGGVLLAGDAAANMTGLGLPIVAEDTSTARESLQKLAGRDFSLACFGHGKPITSGASERFKKKFL